MSDKLTTVNTENVRDVLAELEEAFFDIPFENSDFQNKAFVVASQITPARAYRAIGLRMFSKIRAVKEYLYSIELNKIDTEEKQARIDNADTDEFERRRLQLSVAKMEDERRWGEKLYNDALRELTCLYAEFKKYPRFTREQFEAEERSHFTNRLNRQVNPAMTGAGESLINMERDLPEMESRIDLAMAHLVGVDKVKKIR